MSMCRGEEVDHLKNLISPGLLYCAIPNAEGYCAIHGAEYINRSVADVDMKRESAASASSLEQ